MYELLTMYLECVAQLQDPSNIDDVVWNRAHAYGNTLASEYHLTQEHLNVIAKIYLSK